MPKRRRAPYFQVTFPGPVGGWSSGTWDSGWTRRAYIDIGPFRVRGVVSDAAMSSALAEAAEDPGAVIRLGHILVGRWVLSVTSDGHTERQGLIAFLMTNILLAIPLGMLGLVAAAVVGALTDTEAVWPLVLGFGIWAAQLGMNVKAWLGLSTPPAG